MSTPTSQTRRQDAQNRPLRSRRLLLLEQPDVQLSLNRMLQSAGASVALAHDAHGVIRQACQASSAGEPFDLVLLPMTIEPLDGYAAARVLRQKGVCCPVIGLVSGDVLKQRDSCLEAGCTDVVGRLEDEAALIGTLLRHLSPVQEEAGDPADIAGTIDADPQQMRAILSALAEQLDQQSVAMRLRTIERIERLLREAQRDNQGDVNPVGGEKASPLLEDPEWEAVFSDADRVREEVERWIRQLP